MRVVFAALALAALAVSCFSPSQPPCAFSCAVDHACPANYVCGGDGFCHRADGRGECLLGGGDGGGDAAGDTP
jgi:hypothetical protein